MAQQQSGFSGITKPKKKVAPSFEGGPLKNIGPGNAPARTPALQTFLAATGGAAPAPAASSTPLPIDPTYAQQLLNNGQTAGDTDLGLVNNRNTGLTGLGYKFTQDQTDPFSVSGLTYDPNNPFSQASLLRQHYQEAQRGHTNQLASQGQLYSGALQNQLGIDTQGFQQGDNTIQTAAQKLISDAIQNHRINTDQLGNLNTTALGDSIGRQQPSATPDAPVPVAAVVKKPAALKVKKTTNGPVSGVGKIKGKL